MYPTRKAVAIAAALLTVATAAGCESDTAASDKRPAKPGCPTALAKAKESVKRAEDVDAPWTGPTSGPKAVRNKSIVFISQTLSNPGPTGVAQGVQEASKVVGWKARTLNGKGTPAGYRAAFDKALKLKPDGIVAAAFDPKTASAQVKKAKKLGIPVIGWHAIPDPGPSRQPELFSNITSRVEDVASISADWIIARSKGRAGVVLFTDATAPFAKHKSDLIKKRLATCSDVKLLSYKNLPIPKANSRSTKEVRALLSRFGDKWTYSAAINDLYFGHAAPALRAAGKEGTSAPFNIGAGDGDPSAFERVNGKQFQAATVPEPLSEQGWQIVDEFNRAFTDRPASGYVAPVHISTAANSGGALSWDSEGYRQAYREIWAD
ncbi:MULTISPECIES: substrate-binding domain-containing protein [unclassified Streptomyces]|uniref:substrate-binding domain-containing protein n=1 Tax=unclassified Streptomyces TaxID=2593676 RepID=UPI002DDBAD88|nr:MULTISPECIES: substrate-binding domain-containing protein [unclassified Streptomyces]WSA92711.1 substrate-binding domain-containing protein [Streptomyces sp. NBC_01795]WSB77082.1 substrate-binding domain-containing protein [Streptomyces sp. NBC_01775]WSS14651.1 substrate-binding domain-containing protein [Streptomyces sp. NBC_01186]WSS43465.1 substrate-binding domain-containing protein [Streptomyces sp. NBC_01187]